VRRLRDEEVLGKKRKICLAEAWRNYKVWYVGSLLSCWHCGILSEKDMAIVFK
jgi:hypothetical protein